jgi:hypothetical protein
VDEDDTRGPGFLHAFAPVGFAFGFMLFCFTPLLFVLAVLLWLLGG